MQREFFQRKVKYCQDSINKHTTEIRNLEIMLANEKSKLENRQKEIIQHTVALDYWKTQ